MGRTESGQKKGFGLLQVMSGVGLDVGDNRRMGCIERGGTGSGGL